ncbi:MAG: hypothetical protein M3Z09_09760 [Acidobacteriota bacterium]|nr:hypothetical protein [Acidobacteriota bacterium]
MTSKLPVWFYLLMVFAGGTGVGVFADRIYTTKTVRAATPRNPDDFRKRYVEELKKRLNLDASQVEKLSAILAATQKRMHDLHERERPEITAVHQDQVDRVNAILNGTQRSEYNRMREEREKKRAAERNER